MSGGYADSEAFGNFGGRGPIGHGSGNHWSDGLDLQQDARLMSADTFRDFYNIGSMSDGEKASLAMAIGTTVYTNRLWNSLGGDEISRQEWEDGGGDASMTHKGNFKYFSGAWQGGSYNSSMPLFSLFGAMRLTMQVSAVIDGIRSLETEELQKMAWGFFGTGGGGDNSSIFNNRAKKHFTYDSGELTGMFGAIAKNFGRWLYNINRWRTNERMKVIQSNNSEKIFGAGTSTKSAANEFYPNGAWWGFEQNAAGDTMQYNNGFYRRRGGDSLQLFEGVHDSTTFKLINFKPL